MARQYSSVASEKELASGIDGSAQTISLNNVTGLPGTFPYTLIVDFDTASEEIVTVTDASGTTLTVTRGEDGTVGLSHEQGARIVHGATARDFQESRDHEEASTNVHGVGSGNSVVGTQTVQTLEGKTIDGGDNTLQNVPQSAITDLEADQATQDGRLSTNEGNISSVTSDLSNHEAATNAHGVSTVAGLSEAQTFTNKTINPNSNTLYGWVPIQFGTVNGATTWSISGIPSGFERLRLSARGNMSEAGAVLVGMRLNGTGQTYDYHLYETTSSGLTRLAAESSVSLPRITQWDGSTGCNLIVELFAPTSGTVPSWQSTGWRAIPSGNLCFGGGEVTSNLVVNSIQITAATTANFENVRWTLEGFRVP